MSFYKFLLETVIVIVVLLVAGLFLYLHAFNSGRENVRSSLVGTANQLSTLKSSLTENQYISFETKILIDDLIVSLSSAGVFSEEITETLKKEELNYIVRVDEGFFTIKRNEIFELTDDKTSFGLTTVEIIGGLTHAGGFLDGERFSIWNAEALDFKSNGQSCSLILFGLSRGLIWKSRKKALFRLTCN